MNDPFKDSRRYEQNEGDDLLTVRTSKNVWLNNIKE